MKALRGHLWVLYQNQIAKDVNWNGKEVDPQIKFQNSETPQARAELKKVTELNQKTHQIQEILKKIVRRELSKKTLMRITKPTTMKMTMNLKATKKRKKNLSWECWLELPRINKCLLKKFRVLTKKATVNRSKNSRMMLSNCRLLKIRCLILLRTFSTWLHTVCRDKNYQWDKLLVVMIWYMF